MRINLINARKNANLTQSQVSKKIEVSERHYQKLEAGTSNGSIKIWCKLKSLFNQPIDCLLEQAVDTKQM
nr:helix-turn-helix transcriptional regulator [Sedimentibacter sp.]